MRVLLVLFFCLPTTALALPDAARRGKAVMVQAQCNRCHSITDASGQGRGIPNADQAMHCVDCHTWILGTRGDPAEIARQLEVFPLF